MMKDIKYIYRALYFALGVLIISACAHVVPLQGGEKDEDPPRVILSTPVNGTVNFEERKIEIEFDEYIQVKDINSNLIVSPPLEEKPEILAKGKTLSIKLPDELRDSTTYNVFFGNAVQDFREGNPYENFQFVFSTGEYLDSLSLDGFMLNAFDLQPIEGAYVMLYSNFEDSIPLKEKPDYVGRTNEDGYFRVNNIRNDKFRMFALLDANSNMIFDVPEEEIAYFDSIIDFNVEFVIHIDTIYRSFNDSLGFIGIRDTISYEGEISKSRIEQLADQYDDIVYYPPLDSLENILPDSTIVKSPVHITDSVVQSFDPDFLIIDTIVDFSHWHFPINEYYLLSFVEAKPIPYLKEMKREDKRLLAFELNRPVRDSIKIELIDSLGLYGEDWYFFEKEHSRTKFNYWIKDSSLYNHEKIGVVLSYTTIDTIGLEYWKNDTIDMKFFETDETPEPDSVLNLKSSVGNKGEVHLNKHISFSNKLPLSEVDTNKISFYVKVDTLYEKKMYTIERDTSSFRIYNFDFEKQPEKEYKLEILPGGFKDIYGLENDTIILTFKTHPIEFYGKIIANISGTDSTNVIIQVIKPGKDEVVLTELFIDHDQQLEIEYLEPQEFLLKAIFDRNGNGKWDTGDYINKLQAEDVYYYRQEIKIRSNWDFEISWDFKQ